VVFAAAELGSLSGGGELSGVGGGTGGGRSTGGGGLGGSAVYVLTSAMMKEASGSEHVAQPGPSSHERSGDVQREATSASLPIAAFVACSAE